MVAGNIAAIHGLQSIRSGDTLISGDAARSGGGKKGKQSSAAAQSLVLPGFDIPPAVFALSVEVGSSITSCARRCCSVIVIDGALAVESVRVAADESMFAFFCVRPPTSGGIVVARSKTR